MQTPVDSVARRGQSSQKAADAGRNSRLLVDPIDGASVSVALSGGITVIVGRMTLFR